MVILALVVLLCRAAAPAGAEDDPAPDEKPRLGMSVVITLPITTDTVKRVERFVYLALERAKGENAQPVLIFRFEVPPGGEVHAGTSDFDYARKLARLLTSPQLSPALTVAYAAESIPGHAVLMAMACEEIMMPADAELGPVGAEPDSIGPTEQSAYTEIAKSRNTIPKEVALWLLDPSREVLKVETLGGRKYVALDGPEDVEQLRKDPDVKSFEYLRELIDGQPGQLTCEEARRFDCDAYIAADAGDVAEALNLPRTAMDEDPSLVGGWNARRITLEGPIDTKTLRRLQRLIEDQIEPRKVNFICLRINSGGGSPLDSIQVAGLLADLDPGKVRTVAYVDAKAQADAALVALACDQVVMHPQAKLGGPGEYKITEDDIQKALAAIRDEKGVWRRRSWSLVAAMIDPRLKVFRCTRLGEVGYFCEEELEELRQKQPDAPKWDRGDQVTGEGKPPFDSKQAVEYGLVNHTAESLRELMDHYGVEELTPLEAGWVYALIDVLARPEVSALLLMIAFVAMYAELHAPGIGVGGFVATVCFLLFFWSHYLDQTATELEIILFVAGVGCLLLEIFVLPGFGIFGLGGGCLVLLSLILASVTFVVPRNPYEFALLQRSLLWLAGAGVGIVGAAVLLRRWLPHAPVFNRLFLPPPAGEEAEDISQQESLAVLDDFVGAQGTTTTQLTPSGKARFGDMLLDVITDGDVVPPGTQIEVVEVYGNRVVVKTVDSG